MNLEPQLSRPSLKNRGRDHKIQKLMNLRRFKDADRLINEKIELEPQNPDGYYLRGVLYSYTGRLGQAIEAFKKSLHLNPKHTDSAICLSVLFNDIGRYDEAKKIFEQANTSIAEKRPGDDRTIDRKFSVKHLELADLYYRYRRYDEALDEYTRANVLDPLALDILIKRAKAYAKKGFITRAIQELQTLKKENPSFIPARIQLGLLHFSQGNVLDAEIEWEAALEFAPKSKEILTYLEMAKKKRIRPRIDS